MPDDDRVAGGNKAPRYDCELCPVVRERSGMWLCVLDDHAHWPTAEVMAGQRFSEVSRVKHDKSTIRHEVEVCR